MCFSRHISCIENTCPHVEYMCTYVSIFFDISMYNIELHTCVCVCIWTSTQTDTHFQTTHFLPFLFCADGHKHTTYGHTHTHTHTHIETHTDTCTFLNVCVDNTCMCIKHGIVSTATQFQFHN